MTSRTNDEIKEELKARICQITVDRMAAYKRLSKLPTAEIAAEMKQVIRVTPTGLRRTEMIYAILDAKYTTEYAVRLLAWIEKKG